MTDTIAPRLALAKELAQEAGQLAQRMRAQQDGRFSREKGHQDFVTEADVAVETLIRQRIAAAFADDGLLAGPSKEGGSGPEESCPNFDLDTQHTSHTTYTPSITSKRGSF